MKLIVKKGRTSLLTRIFAQDSSSAVGAGLTGLTSGSANLVCYRARDDDGNAAGTQVTLSTGTRGTWSSGGFVEKDATNMPGVYELGLPDAGQATGSESVTYMLRGATNLAPLALEVQLVAYDPQSATNLGLSQIDAAISSRMATYTQPAGFLAATFPTGTVANTTNITAATGVDITKILGTAISTPATAGILDVNVKNMNNVAGTPITTVKAVQGLTTADVVVTVSGNVNGSVASVTGAVGSVTGAVGSVTGNVGGSVASVTAAVGITSNIKKNQALAKFEFLGTDSVTHAPKTGVAFTATRSIDGGAFAAGTLSAVTEIASGLYSVDFGAGDLNGNVIVLRATGAATDDVLERLVTQP
jgi:hypothetical protein